RPDARACGAGARRGHRQCGDGRRAATVAEAAAHGQPGRVVIVCRSHGEIDKLRRVNQLVAEILAELRTLAKPGATTGQLDRVAEHRVRAAGAVPAFKGYHGYPATICASVNEQVVHGIPSDRVLVEGDILSIDMGAKLDGFFGDCAVTVPIGHVSAEADTLLRVTDEALALGIESVKPG